MRAVYTILTYVATAHLWVAQYFSKKLRLFVSGRRNTFSKLSEKLSPNDKSIWFHCASLGEYEQGLPIMEEVKKFFPKHKIVITFFSPSGYEIRKNAVIADVVVYLPMDTNRNAKRFLNLVNPSLALFVKYEFWPNYLFALKERKTPSLLISGVFRKDQIFFKPYGSFMRKALFTFDHFFVQENRSKDLLKELGHKNVTVSGDTRFDRVSHQIEHDNHLDFMDEFKKDSLCIVCGSTWPEDENVLLPFINASEGNIKFVIAPHKIDAIKIESFVKKLNKTSVLYSELTSESTAREVMRDRNLSETTVLIVNTIGLLTKIYSYADIAFVGGAMGKTGLHNILEPATFGVPIVIGNNYSEFPEAERLRSLAGLFSVDSAETCSEMLEKLVTDANFRSKTGMIAGHFVNSNTGATQKTMAYIKQLKI